MTVRLSPAVLCCMHVILCTVFVGNWAPGLALRGPDGSMNVAVDHMITEYRAAFKRLLAGIVALHGLSFRMHCYVFPASADRSDGWFN